MRICHKKRLHETNNEKSDKKTWFQTKKNYISTSKHCYLLFGCRNGMNVRCDDNERSKRIQRTFVEMQTNARRMNDEKELIV